jgi:hypothetical protein
VATIAVRPNASCSAFSGSMIAIVVQFGLATMPRAARSSSSGLTSETTSGTSSSIRNAEELSTTTAPAAANFGPHAFEIDPPAEKIAMSKPPTVSSASPTTTRPLPRSRPAERSLANGTTSEAGKSRFSSRSIICVPTAPVAPTTATR